MGGFMVAGRRVGPRKKKAQRNKRYVAGANLERQIKTYFEKQGFDAVRSAGSHGEFDVWADNGLVIWKVQSKKNMTIEEANVLVEELAISQQKKFEVINHPIAIFVCQGIKSGVPYGVTRLIVPAETTARLAEEKRHDKERTKDAANSGTKAASSRNNTRRNK